MQPVVRALDAGRRSEAVHQFVQALSHDASLRQGDLVARLVDSWGKARVDALILSFAEHPCMVCKKGLIRCDECEGRGTAADHRICERCLGLGTTNCDFCAGSGWITYNYVPAPLRLAVVLSRSKRVLTMAKAQLAESFEQKAEGASATRKSLAQELLRLNRLMGALNNTIGVARHPPDAAPRAKTVLKSTAVACARAALRLDRRIRQVLVLLAKDAQGKSSGAERNRRESGERKARFYATLAKSPDFRRTSLHHVYLRGLHRKA